MFVEGEEESGSPSLEPFLESQRDELRADICVVSDTNMWNIETPALATLLRGLLYAEITLSGPAHDLHSGLYGGAAPNPLNVLSRILGQLHDADGRVQVPGFYDDVEELDERERRRLAELPFDEAAFLGSAGLTASTGEAGRSTLERIWTRPTCDINGMWGGYTGPGSKTVIPAKASAKISFRLVPQQDPGKILAGLRTFSWRSARRVDCRFDLTTHATAAPLRVPVEFALRPRRAPCAGAGIPASTGADRHGRTSRRSRRSSVCSAWIPCCWASASRMTACTRRTRSSSCAASPMACAPTLRCWPSSPTSIEPAGAAARAAPPGTQSTASLWRGGVRLGDKSCAPVTRPEPGLVVRSPIQDLRTRSPPIERPSVLIRAAPASPAALGGSGP